MIIALRDELEKILPASRVRTRYIDLVSFASDAGFYYLLPKAVVQPVNESEITALFHFSVYHKTPLVFRTGGTSLSGQSITDGILVDLSQYWNRVKVEDDGALVRVQPGITGAMVNAHLKKYRTKIGPDPSSISAAMMGGILSNNSSGMCCGVKLNSYHTLKSIRFVLPDGKMFNTEDPNDYVRFEDECHLLKQRLKDIKQQILTDRELYNKIRKKYQTKTTIGYSLNAFIDYERPLDILAHLLIGAEGTLAFISEAVLHTVPDYPFKSTALLYFPTIYAACKAIVPLTEAGALMVELMDRASLHAVENMPGMPSVVKSLHEDASALLVEFQENAPELLNERVKQFVLSSANLSLLNPPVFTTDPKEQDFFWKVRKGLFPAVGAVRKSGTTVILEDIAFPVELLGDAIIDLQRLFHKYEYNNAIIFGHAKDGNIHFVITQSFNTESEILRYDQFMKEVIRLVVGKYNGTLKAEHGTGRNMAPFVEIEWGGEAYQIMKRIKDAIDPASLLNPGVIINDDKDAHIKFLKGLPTVEEEVDRCIECGYCEHKCPSRDITTTPRRRIVIRRILQTLKRQGDKEKYKLLLDQYQYDGNATCAVDGLCAIACPVDIDTGDLTKRLRNENHSLSANRFALSIARNFKTAEWLARFGLKCGSAVNNVFGKNAMLRLTAGLTKLSPSIPLWSDHFRLPPNLSVLKNKRVETGRGTERNTIVYFPACISRAMGTYEGKQKNIMETFMSVCEKSRIGVIILDDVKGSCCGQIFSSKGFKEAHRYTASRIMDNLWTSSSEGTYPVVMDVSSCVYTLRQMRPLLDEGNKRKFDNLTILDSIDFLHDMVIPAANVKVRRQTIVLHPVCSLEKMKTTDTFLKVAKHFAHEVTIPRSAGCCGMAGDRGFLFPELTASATHHEASEVKQKEYDGYYSSTRTCEVAMTDAVKQNYESILYLVDEAI
ncbi:MAG: FAD-binding and (Fe-S)-binding domain-containing protein [Cyclobacteriaceae bacterium]